MSVGIIADGVTDNTEVLQDLLLASGGKTVILPDGAIKITTPLLLPPAGLCITGAGSGGDFGPIIRPVDCPAFDLSNVHHSLLKNFMIWPQGSSPPSHILTLNNVYSIILRDIRFHFDQGYRPTGAIIQQMNQGGGCNDIIYDHVMIRSDDPRGLETCIEFGPSCGSATLIGCDLETAQNLITHKGGNITVLSGYMERAMKYGICLEPVDDPKASFSMLGGTIYTNNSAVPIAIKDGCKNTRLNGTYIGRPDGWQGWVYGLKNSKNIQIHLANYDYSKWGQSVPLDPTIIQFG